MFKIVALSMSKTYIMHFLLVFLCLENLHLLYFHMTLFLPLCIYYYHHKQVQNSIFIKMLTFFHILVYFFNSLLSSTLKAIVLLISECLTYPIIWESFIHKGLMTSSSSLYPGKYSNDLFYRKVLFLEINLL